MSPQQKISAIRLYEKISQNPSYAKRIGIEIKAKNTNTDKKEKLN